MEEKKLLEKILDAKEISEIQMFLERPIMMNAVRKVLFQPILSEGTMKPGEAYNPNRNYMLGLVGSQYANQGMITDETLIHDIKARFKATELIQIAFNELEKLRKVVEVEKTNVNKAR
jgi:hypothetical protein